jgi:spermidine/putrescine ABC transporter ATP-binding subunit
MNAGPSENSVEIRSVTKRFGDFVAVDDVSLAIHRGEFFSLLGPSGCGKTTLLRMIAGFESPSSGSIFLAGNDVTRVPAHLRSVNLVFQHYALFPHLTAHKNIAFGLRYKNISRSESAHRVAAALDLVQLSGLGARFPHELSGGQRQRVALARALVLQPQVLLLDEPLGALDQKLRKEMQVELKNLQRSLGITFIFVTHDQEEAITMSDRIAVMNGGKVEQVGPAHAVFEKPQTQFVAGFMGAINVLDASMLDASMPEGPTLDKEPGSEYVHVIRPEKLRLGFDAAAADPRMICIPVKIRQRIYQGIMTIWQVQTISGAMLTVCQQNEKPIDSSASQATEHAFIWFDRAHVVPVRAERAATAAPRAQEPANVQ